MLETNQDKLVSLRDFFKNFWTKNWLRSILILCYLYYNIFRIGTWNFVQFPAHLLNNITVKICSFIFSKHFLKLLNFNWIKFKSQRIIRIIFDTNHQLLVKTILLWQIVDISILNLFENLTKPYFL
jgi:hypothetical protein